MYLNSPRRRRETVLVRKRTTALYKAASSCPSCPSWPAANGKSCKRKKNKKRIKHPKKNPSPNKKKTRKYYSARQSPDKVLKRYTKPPQDIVVYLKSPRRRRDKLNVLRPHKATFPKLGALSLLWGDVLIPCRITLC